MLVKICGITNSKDALLAVNLGAWALGFNFYEQSPRYISPERAKEIIQQLPTGIVTVGIFMNASSESINQICAITRIQMLQLHGDESLNFCKQFSCPVIKVIRPRTSDDLLELDNYPDLFAVLVDAYSDQLRGGTGLCADWLLAAEIAAKRSILLAGGLDADNVVEAIRSVKPQMIDVCSGVEQSPGAKSLLKMHALFRALQQGGY
ncbi:MAG: phosphoribosylanthranilate isomerase [Gammaproteobacteria bacterium]